MHDQQKLIRSSPLDIDTNEVNGDIDSLFYNIYANSFILPMGKEKEEDIRHNKYINLYFLKIEYYIKN